MGEASRNALLRATLAVAVLSTAASCDIVQGFENAGDALFPPQKTYLETPGFRLAEGGFRRLNVGVGDELYLLARSSDVADASALYSMRYVDPKPCKIDHVGRYWTSGLPNDHPAQVVYLENNDRRGPVHFADARCNVHDLVLEDADVPLEESSEGLLIPTGDDLVMVDAPKGTYRTVASDIQRFYPNGPGAHYLLIGGRLGAYATGTWAFIGWAGENVVDVGFVGGLLVFEDSTGVHGLSVLHLPTGPEVTVTNLDPDGCHLGWVSSNLLAYHSPCADLRLSLFDASNGRTTPLDYAADPGSFAVELDPKVNRSDAKLDRDYFYYSLRPGGTLVVRTPEGAEFELGTGARLDRTNFDDDGEYGLAMLDVDAANEIGRLVRWDRDGNVETLATNVFLNSSDVIIDWNGLVGDHARITDDGELEVLLERVPRRDYQYQDASRRWRAILDDSDGVTGTLSIDDSGSRSFANKRVIARGVRHPRHQFLDVVLPGIAFVSNYDPPSDTGRLEYNNLELGFRGTISEGVSDFIPAGNGLLYTVPFGSARGVWIARAQ